jgi:hypothetical protein
MRFRTKPLAAGAAVAAALAVAAPATSATAATTTPHAAQASTVRVVPPPPVCLFLAREVQFNLAVGNLPAATFFSNILVYSGCGGAAI